MVGLFGAIGRIVPSRVALVQRAEVDFATILNRNTTDRNVSASDCKNAFAIPSNVQVSLNKTDQQIIGEKHTTLVYRAFNIECSSPPCLYNCLSRYLHGKMANMDVDKSSKGNTEINLVH